MPKRIKGVAATRIFKSIQASLWWCTNCDIPLVSEYCSRCGSAGKRLRVVPPGDVRPMFEYEHRLFVDSVSKIYGRRFVRSLGLDRGLVVLNRIQGVDASYEVVAHGMSVGVWYFDIARLEWRFKPSYAGVKVAVEEAIPPYAIFRNVVREGSIVSLNEAERYEIVDGCEWVSLRMGSVYGLGKIKNGKVIVVKSWRSVSAVPGVCMKSASIDDAVKGNREALESMEAEAVGFLRREISSRSAKVFVSFSGGKDSVVAAFISSVAGVCDKALFVDTGLELPTTYEVVDRVSKLMEVETLRSPYDFWSLVELLDIPARDYRWCCKVLKILPLNRWRDRVGASAVVTIVGQRRYESISRALAGRVSRSASRPSDIILAPINDWTALAVHLYIAMRGLPLNKAYLRGFDRVGCFMCPTSRLAELEHVKKEFRDLWSRWVEVLERKRRRANLPREWIDYGLWRWRYEIPGDVINTLRKRVNVSRLVENVVLNNIVVGYVQDQDSRICVEISLKRIGSIDLKKLRQVLRVVALTGALERDRLEISGSKGIAIVRSNGLIEACSHDPKWLTRFCKRIVAAIAMSTLCIGCNLCEDACHKNAIERGLPKNECSGCARCTAMCPLASSLSRDVEYALKVVLRAIS